MTQTDFDKMLADITGDTVIDEQFELDWINEQLPGLEAGLKKSICAAKLYKYLLDEKALTTTAEEVKRGKACIEFLKARKAKIYGH